MKAFLFTGLFFLGFVVGIPLESMACHEKGPMGFSNRRPGMLTADISYSPTYSSASTSGTSGCKNWDFLKLQQETQNQYVKVEWENLSEEAARGSGIHLAALAQLLGCHGEKQISFDTLLKRHYHALFFSSADSQEKFVAKLKKLMNQQEIFRTSCAALSSSLHPSFTSST
ncbi:MAG: DUF3015 family protein [SAR324 cluster bacterium]|nr:DUF3015 family protein [SAR324 cluster bacterium]